MERRGAKPDMGAPEPELNLNDSSKFRPMVQWFSPGLLFRAGFRSAIAELFGQYSDQRVIQDLTDPILINVEKGDEAEVFRKVADRYNYSTEAVGGEPFWFDFTADLGDGFDPTYGVCHMISQTALYGENSPKKSGELAVKDWHGEPLPAGRLLVLGGDEIYPFPSHEEYENRFSNPFRLALPANETPDGNGHVEPGRRDLFAIPGNHDWYDGLSAFQDLFMAADDGLIKQSGKNIGGWQTHQHRSYFAIKLPYNWWIWGADIHLNRPLDEGQLKYFRSVAKTMGPGDKFILCTAQPSWYYWGTKQETLARENLEALIDSPIQAGARLHGIFSGDSHHYARYQEASGVLGNFNLFTVGGGGAYSHGTFHLKPEIPLPWLGQKLKFLLNRKLEPGVVSEDGITKPKVVEEPAVYPTKVRSKAIAWANIFMPFKNFSFAVAIGLIYLLLTWSFSVINVPYNVKLDKEDLTVSSLEKLKTQAKSREGLRKITRAPTRSVIDHSTGEIKAEPIGKFKEEQIIGGWTLDLIDIYFERLDALGKRNVTGMQYASEWFWALYILSRQGMDLLLIGIASSPMAFVLLLGFWFVLYLITRSKYEGWRGTIFRLMAASGHFLAHLVVMWSLFCAFLYLNFNMIKPWLTDMGITRFLGVALEFWIPSLTAAQMVPIGGIVGGMVFGIYLALGYRLFKVNEDWVFSSQRITRFKCFLRMSVEPDKLTIYPIGLDNVPTRNGVLAGWTQAKNPENGASKLEPRVPLQPRLIEGPIVVRTDDVRNIDRTGIV